MLKKFISNKIHVTKNALFFLSRVPTHHIFTFNSRFLHEHKVHLSLIDLLYDDFSITTLFKRDLHRCFSVNIVKFLATPILKNICERLLLYLVVLLYCSMNEQFFCFTIFLCYTLTWLLQWFIRKSLLSSIFLALVSTQKQWLQWKPVCNRT